MDTVYGINITLRDTGSVEAGAKRVEESLTNIGEKSTASFSKTRQGIESISTQLRELESVGKNLAWLSALNLSVNSLIDAVTSMDRFNSSVAVATGSISNAAAEYDHVRQLSQRLGLEITGTANAYASFAAAARGTALEGQKARDVFDSVAGVSAKMSLNAEQSQGVFLALSQMMSKGVVSAEEFRQQLGERLPIATEAGARAMGVTTAEFVNLLNSGKLLSEDFLPKFAKALDDMGGSTGPVNTLQASLNRLSNNFTEVKRNLADASPLSESVKWLSELTSHTQGLTVGIAALVTAGGSYSALKMGSAALEAVNGFRQKTSAMLESRAAALAAAEADATATASALALARARETEVRAAMIAADGEVKLALATNGVIPAQAAATQAANLHAASLARLEAAQAAASASAGIARGALALLGGPIGAITLALTLGVTAWMAWGNAAEEAAKKADEARRNRLAKAQANGATLQEALKADIKLNRDEELAASAAYRLAQSQGDRDAAMQRLELAKADRLHNEERLSQIANTERAQAARSAKSATEDWQKFHASKGEQLKMELEQLDGKYAAEKAKASGNSELLLQLERDYQAKKQRIIDDANKKAPKDPGQSQADAIQADNWKRELEASGVSASIAAQQVKVWQMALRGAKPDLINAAQAQVDESAALEAATKLRIDSTKAWDEAGKVIARHNDLARQAVDQLKFDADLEGKSTIEKARLNAERRVELDLLGQIAALKEKYKGTPGAADEGIQAIRESMPGLMESAGNTAQKKAERDLGKQADVSTPGGAEQKRYEDELAKLKEFEDAKLLGAGEYAKRREQIEKAHQTNMALLAAQGKLSREQFDKLEMGTKLQIVAGGLMQVMGTLAQHNKTAFEINKAAGIANAIVNTYTGVTQALKDYPPPFSYAMAANTAAMGFAQVSAIQSAQFGGSAGAAPVGGGGVGAGAIPGQQTNNAVPYGGSATGSAQQTQAPVQVQITVQSMSMSDLTPAGMQSIADSLTPMLQQALARNGQNVAVMV